ncbi:hypothetical protein Hanom_Chr07g00678621 [Helianthus anomalus]
MKLHVVVDGNAAEGPVAAAPEPQAGGDSTTTTTATTTTTTPTTTTTTNTPSKNNKPSSLVPNSVVSTRIGFASSFVFMGFSCILYWII